MLVKKLKKASKKNPTTISFLRPKISDANPQKKPAIIIPVDGKYTFKNHNNLITGLP